MHLKEHHQMLWCRFLSQQKDLYSNISVLLEILLEFIGNLSVVEHSFSNLRSELCENRLSIKNKCKNQSLLMRCDMPTLNKLMKDCQYFIKQLIEKSSLIEKKKKKIYMMWKKWRWGIKSKISEETKKVNRILFFFNRKL